MRAIGELFRRSSGFSMREQHRSRKKPLIVASVVTLGTVAGLTLGSQIPSAIEALTTSTDCELATNRFEPDPQTTGDWFRDTKRGLYEKLSFHDAYGAYITVNNEGDLVATDCPTIIPIKLSATHKNIRIYRAPNEAAMVSHDLQSASGVRAMFATRVFGGRFEGERGSLLLNFAGKTYDGGEWYMVTNKDGKPIHPTSGMELSPREYAHFVTANNVALIPR